ncbi:hypothetical protein AYI68_g826 [Smittium mucronatum]|uniref:Reverse transcriptase domain-containing protein n=1 Tax=Smittium mucronatum TaxID=133383 RepID=A0A1R0H7E1_9FUNG|nr:hypothetical protein AYI68_g826 [Smittium mucronatum]
MILNQVKNSLSSLEAEAINVEQGLRLGDLLAPILYNLAIEPLLTALRNRVSGIKVVGESLKKISYADDILLSKHEKITSKLL